MVLRVLSWFLTFGMALSHCNLPLNCQNVVMVATDSPVENPYEINALFGLSSSLFGGDGDGVADENYCLCVCTSRKAAPLYEALLAPISRRIYVCASCEEVVRATLPYEINLNSTSKGLFDRKELLTPFNFAAFYTGKLFPSARRVLYLDTDTMMTKEGELSELFLSNLNGHALGAVQDCLIRMSTYVPWPPSKVLSDVVPKLRSLAKRYGGPCICNRGVVLFDVELWSAGGYLEKIEELLRLHLHTGTLWRRNGVSQPPFLIAISNNYHRLNPLWNIRGLGRKDIPKNEYFSMAKIAKKKYDVNVSVSEYPVFAKEYIGGINPYVHPYAHKAKILHFNGNVKPWVVLQHPERLAPQCMTEDGQFTACANIWYNHVQESIVKLRHNVSVQRRWKEAGITIDSRSNLNLLHLD